MFFVCSGPCPATCGNGVPLFNIHGASFQPVRAACGVDGSFLP